MSARLFYELDGPTDAPVLVMGGSIGTTTSMWERQLPALTRHFRVLRYDHRGHGRSEVPIGPYTVPDLGGDVLALLDEAGLDRVHYCGLSLGGMVGLWLAAHAPDRIDRLAVACTSPYVGAARTRYAERAVVVRDRGMASIAELAVSRWFTPEFAEREPDTVARVTKELAAVPAEGYASCCEALSTVDLRPELSEIRLPTLVIGGADDVALPPAEHAVRVSEGVAGARLVTIPNAAHLANVEAPEAFTEALLDHLLNRR